MVTLATRSLFINGGAERGDDRGHRRRRKASGAARTSGDGGATIPRHPNPPIPTRGIPTPPYGATGGVGAAPTAGGKPGWAMGGNGFPSKALDALPMSDPGDACGSSVPQFPQRPCPGKGFLGDPSGAGGSRARRVPLGSSLAQDFSRLAEPVSITTFLLQTYFDKNKVKAARLLVEYKFAALALPLPPPRGGGIKTESFPFEGQYFLPSLPFPTEYKMENLVYRGFAVNRFRLLPGYLMLYSMYRIM